MNLNDHIRDIHDFPKPGIIFKDITPLLANPEMLKYAADKLYEKVKEQKVDKVIGIEARGFIFGPLLAERLDAGFVPVRKKGKLPSETVSVSYDLEYGTDSLEIHVDAIQKGDRILIHDDVLATGGTASAVEKLVLDLGGVVVQCNFIIELSFLEGRQKLKTPVASLLNY